MKPLLALHFKGVKRIQEIIYLLINAILPMILFMRVSGWSKISAKYPLDYSADILQYGNWVSNAQSGSVLFTKHLGGPLGQQYGLSAYGFEWIQSKFVSIFADYSSGPWLAMNRYILFSYILTGLLGYLSLRWIGISRAFSTFGSLAFNMIEIHQRFAIQELHMAMIGVIPIFLVLLIKISTGSTLLTLFRFPLKPHAKRVCTFLLLTSMTLLIFTSAFYYDMLLIVLYFSVALFFVFHKSKRIYALRTALAGGMLCIPLLISYLPITLARLHNHLGISEPSTTDRRPFAAYANGGDFFSLFSPSSPNSLFYHAISKVDEVRRFFLEYWTSPINNNAEYSTHPMGLAVPGLLVLTLLIYFQNSKGSLVLPKIRRALPQLFSSFWLFILTFFWFLRGGIGTFFSFTFPFMRSYSRFSIFLIFLAIAMLALVASHPTQFGKLISVIAATSLVLVTLDNISSNSLISQEISNSMTKQVGVNELPGASKLATGFTIRTLGILGTDKLVRNANILLPAGCTVLELPLVSYPVDFGIGVVSYYGYEELKPGIEPGNVHWSGGGIPGTPNNAYQDRWLPSFQKGSYTNFLPSIKKSNYCGILMFRGLQDGFASAGPAAGSYYSSGEVLTSTLISIYGRPCYSDISSAVDLYCLTQK